MKSTFLSHALFAGVVSLAVTAFADTNLVDVRVSPERDQIYKTDGAEAIFDVNLHGKDSTSARHVPINLALVIDHSGSMSEGEKIENAREAACSAIDQLDPSDTFSLVQFDNNVDVLIPAQPVENKEQLKEVVNGIEPGGSTALYAGVQEGAHQLRKYFDEKNVNRVILISDGIANVGPSSPDEIADLGRDIREKGASVTTIGLGADYNEDVMASIAEASGANYYYVQDAEKLPGILQEELGQVKNVVAQNLRIIIELPDGVEPIEIIGMPDAHFEGNKVTISLGSFYGSQRRDLLVRCRIKSPKGKAADIGNVHVAYSAPGNGAACESDAVANVKFTDKKADSEKSVDADVATQVALSENAATRQRALQLQDEGKLKDAADLLRGQASADAAGGAALDNSKLASEAKSLRSIAGQLESAAPLSNVQRKDFQYENYNQANQRDQQ
jgi:Ca-activated chloride channel family protein